jgi:hypothetical protein
MDIVTFNVGGTIKSTNKNNIPEGSLLYKLTNNSKFATLDSNGNIFIDRDPKYFDYILNYLRTNRLIIGKDIVVEALELEFDYFQIECGDLYISNNLVCTENKYRHMACKQFLEEYKDYPYDKIWRDISKNGIPDHITFLEEDKLIINIDHFKWTHIANVDHVTEDKFYASCHNDYHKKILDKYGPVYNEKFIRQLVMYISTCTGFSVDSFRFLTHPIDDFNAFYTKSQQEADLQKSFTRIIIDTVKYVYCNCENNSSITRRIDHYMDPEDIEKKLMYKEDNINL